MVTWSLNLWNKNWSVCHDLFQASRTIHLSWKIGRELLTYVESNTQLFDLLVVDWLQCSDRSCHNQRFSTEFSSLEVVEGVDQLLAGDQH